MRNQTFGVEIEMNNITRKNAAIVAAGFFGTNRYEYVGGSYQTWIAYDQNNEPWKFMYDGSIHGPADERCECVTPILKYDDIERLQELIRVLRKAGAKSDAGRGCGVHIHVGVKALDGNNHTPQSLRNLANIMAAHESLLAGAIKIDTIRMGQYCRPVDAKFLAEVNKKKPQTMTDLADVWYQSQGCEYGRTAHYNNSRYHMLNLHAVFTKGTVEFRLFQFDRPGHTYKGGLHAGKLKAYIQFCLAISAFAKSVTKASPKPQNTDNPKFAMRTWLVRMGMVGDEFATAREMLTKNLAGDAAWRHGRQVA